MIKTECPSDHSRTSLCCKMEAELTTFLTSDRSWFCHLDDDNYLNVPALVKMLSSYSYKEEWYIGKASISAPLEMADGPGPLAQLLLFVHSLATGAIVRKDIQRK